MKKIALLILTLSILSCSLDDNENNTTTQSTKWSLIKVTGGVTGTEINLEVGQITWVFDELNNNIVVEENVEDLSHALSEGTYTYSIQNISNADFLFVDDVEYGDIIVGQNSFTIDQNITSANTNTSDKFIYKFVR